jgi:hypothetical protein
MTIDLLAALAPVVPVVEEPGWRNRGHAMPFEPRALMVHHDASAVGPSPAISRLLEEGRPGISGPLAHMWACLGCGGAHPKSVHLIAAGHCNHAGLGAGWGIVPKDAGNRFSYALETDHTTGEPLDPELYELVVTASRALLAAMHANPMNALPGHKEYAPGRKTDPDWDMPAMRGAVAGAPIVVPFPDLGPGILAPPPPVPTSEVNVAALPLIRQGASGQPARVVQGLLVAAGYGITVDGAFGPRSTAALVAFQSGRGLAADGVAGPRTYSALLGI